MTHDQLSPTYTLHEARAAGLTRAQLRDDGIRVSRGVYVSRAVPLSLRAAARALAPVLPEDAVFSHGTAAALLGAPVPHEWPLHVAVPAGSYRPRRRGLRVRVRDLHAGDVVSVRGRGSPAARRAGWTSPLICPRTNWSRWVTLSTGPATSTPAAWPSDSIEQPAPEASPGLAGARRR
jgi:hypothetical protein